MRMQMMTAALGLFLSFPLAAQDTGRHWSSGRPDGHAPIGVMGDHTHEKGEMMLSYRYMYMSMEGLRSGSTSLSSDDVLQVYPVTPEKMPMMMHMVGVMFAPSDRITLMGMVPFASVDMDHVTGMGGAFTTESSGLGDLTAQAMVTLYDRHRMKVHANAGVSLPTGSIDESDVTPASGGQEVRLPYPMQVGSGTFDLMPGITWLWQNDSWSSGAQASGVIRLGENGNGYTLGNVGSATMWGARQFSPWLSGSIRLAGRTWDKIDGADPSLNSAMVPTADPRNAGGNRLDALLGINFEVRKGSLKGQRLAIEAGVPLYQSVNGIQLESDWMITAGWQYAFRVLGE